MRYLLALLLSLTLINITGCKVESSSEELDSPSTGSELEKQSLAILQKHCASCHDSSSSNQGNINYIMNVGVMLNNGLIIPGNPDGSLVYAEINTDAMPTVYSLGIEDKTTIRDWILELGTTEGPPVDKVFYSDIWPIIQSRCVSCHGASNDVDLRTYESTLLAVWPGNPEASLIYDSIDSGRMPKNSSTVSASEMQLIYDWIKQGAQN